MKPFISRAADVLLGGGIITCPTEGVFGLSCMPDNPAAIKRLLRIKRRDPAKGLILIAATKDQLKDWIDVPVEKIPDANPSQPISWIVPAAVSVSALVRGDHDEVAVRVTTNPVAQALCEAVESPLVSTSANIVGEAPIRNRLILRRKFAGCVDYMVPGDCGPATGPSEIRNLSTGEVLRANR
jgi:L-threonylcarbamoyladenylate synthase